MDTYTIIVVIIVFVVLCWRFGTWLIKPLETQMKTRICPFCKSRIPNDAMVCKFCRRDIDPVIKPMEKMEAQDIVAQRELRLEAIKKIMDKFSSEYPEVNFNYDTKLGDIIIKVPSSHPDPKPKPKMILEKMIEELRNFGVDAKARFFADATIKTIGIFDGAIEETLANVDRDKTDGMISNLSAEKVKKQNYSKINNKLALEQKLFNRGVCPACGEKIDTRYTKCFSCDYDFYENKLIQ